MDDRRADDAVEARLRDYLAAELHQAELDFPHMPRPERPPQRRRFAVGLVAATIAVLAFVIVAPRFAGTSLDGMGGSPMVSTARPTGPLASVAAASAGPSPAASVAPSMSAPSAAASVPAGTDCGRIAPAPCLVAIDLARAGQEVEVAGATRIVVDDTCPTGLVGAPAPSDTDIRTVTMCDRLYPFDSIVVFVTAGGDTTGWITFHVTGLEYNEPTLVERWVPDVPPHVVTVLRSGQPSP